ncbi:MAG: hypothetical protein ACE5FU_05005, partial [Nitrospinota bacterium]
MDICKTNECDFAAITRLVREHPFFDFCFTFDAQENLVREYYAERLKKNFLSPDRFFFTAKENGSVSGVVSVRKLGWDTEFFKYPMGSLEDLCFLAGMNKSGAGLVQAATGFGKD